MIQELIDRPMYVERLRPFIGREPVKVLTGMRRSGKSVMLRLIQEEIAQGGADRSRFISLNFEDMGNARLCNAEALHAEVSDRIAGMGGGKVWLFLDEIQEVQDWERFVNSCRVEFDCDIYITGSNARLLSGELATYLAGRYVELAVYPFSFAEFCAMLKRRGASPDVPAAFRQYVSLGGMPFLSNIAGEPEACAQYLRDVYSSIVLKDVVRRHNIRNVDQMDRVVTYALANVGRPFSATSISKYFKSEFRSVSHDTVLNYLRACQEAFLLYRAPCEDLPGKKRLSVNEKYYASDHGLRAAVFGRAGGPWPGDIGQVLENIVCMELLRRGYGVAVGRNGEREIDFVASKGSERLYVQVSYLMAEDATVEREFGAYRGVPDNYPKYVVSLDEFDMSRDGIRHVDLRDFLLMEAWS